MHRTNDGAETATGGILDFGISIDPPQGYHQRSHEPLDFRLLPGKISADQTIHSVNRSEKSQSSLGFYPSVTPEKEGRLHYLQRLKKPSEDSRTRLMQTSDVSKSSAVSTGQERPRSILYTLKVNNTNSY